MISNSGTNSALGTHITRSLRFPYFGSGLERGIYRLPLLWVLLRLVMMNTEARMVL